MDISGLITGLFHSQNLFIFLAITFLAALAIGDLIERIKVPWIFSALIIGFLFATFGVFTELTASQTFIDLAQLGMYFLLFIIGFEINLGAYKQKTGYIIKATFFVILFEAIAGTLLLHYLFGVGWIISLIASISFATVGEAILVPILDRFGITNKPIGQTILGIGTLDDIVELLVFVLAIAVVGVRTHENASLTIVFITLAALFALAFLLVRLKRAGKRFHIGNVHHIFLFSLFVFFLFIGIGDFVGSAALAAIMAGVALGNFVPKERLSLIESEIKTMCYGFFAPLFFLWVGASIDLTTLLAAPLLILIVIIVTTASKIIATSIISGKEMNLRESVVVGIGLSVRFSTSIVIIKILFDNGLINQELYSVLIGSSVILTFIIPLVFSVLIDRWKLGSERTYDL